MKRYFKELMFLFIQFFMFYIFPLFAGPTDALGMVILIIIATFLLSVLIGILSKNKVKYLYPVIISILFIPSVFIYYNSSALIHSLWYLIMSIIGLLVGCVINFIVIRYNKCVFLKKQK